MPEGLQRIADILPLTQGIKLIKAASLGMEIDSVLLPIIIMGIVAVICIGLSIKFFKWE